MLFEGVLFRVESYIDLHRHIKITFNKLKSNGTIDENSFHFMG